jgi:hypothetical protein
MTIVESRAARATEDEELRDEVARLRTTVTALATRLEAAGHVEGALRHRLGEVQEELAEARTALWHERATSSIRARLLGDITATAWLARRRAIGRAERVERLLER